MPLIFEEQSWWPWTSLLIPHSSFIPVSSNACRVQHNMPGRAVSDRSLLHTSSPWFNTLPVHRAESHGSGNASKTSHSWRPFYSPCRRAESFFNCKPPQTERTSLCIQHRDTGTREIWKQLEIHLHKYCYPFGLCIFASLQIWAVQWKVRALLGKALLISR